jgi:ABC-type multidrug transport system permease subunit
MNNAAPSTQISDPNAAGQKRGIAPRWYGAAISAIVFFGFALYAQQDPGDFPGILIALAIGLFASYGRDNTGAAGGAFPDIKPAMWGLFGVIVFLSVLFLGGIYFRRLYDLVWIPIATGLVAATTIFLLSENERRHINKSD